MEDTSRPMVAAFGAACWFLIAACGDDGRQGSASEATGGPGSSPTTTSAGTSSDGGSTAVPTGSGPGSSGGTGTGTTDSGTTTTASTTTSGAGCGPCDQPNQQCEGGVCVTGCQGQVP